MFDAKVCFPVSFECIHADFTIIGHVGMKNFGEEKTFGWNTWKIFAQD